MIGRKEAQKAPMRIAVGAAAFAPSARRGGHL